VTLVEEARDRLDAAVEIRRRVHRHPEVGLYLPRTQAVVLEELERLGLRGEGGTSTTSVVATLSGDHPGPTVLLRADMDALPMPEDTGLPFASEVDGAMHACAHDSHVAMLLGAAGVLSDHRADLHGNVHFMFQPGEEGFHGARHMIEEGLLDGPNPPSAAFALHSIAYRPAGTLDVRPGPMMASSDWLRITVRGRGGHASAPHRSLDPIPAACEIALALQTMVTRSVDVFDPAVVTIAHIEAGTTNNVIPESAFLEGTIRTLSGERRAAVVDGARRVARGIAATHGMDVTFECSFDVDDGYPVTVNDEVMTALMLDVARELLGPEQVEEMAYPVMGAEDFSYVLQRVPGAMGFLGVAPQGVPEPAPNHSSRMMIDEAAMADGIALYAGLALRYLDERRS
jgi:hippurate hydrolase